jgi:transposase
MRVKKSLFTTQNQAFPRHLAGFWSYLGTMPENIYHRLKNASVEQIAREEDLSPGEVQGIFDLVNQSKKKAWSPMKKLSIDEISIRKGAKKFKTVVGCVDTGNLLEVIDSHKQKEIIEILKQQPLEIREAVEEVSVDMWGGFPLRH